MRLCPRQISGNLGCRPHPPLQKRPEHAAERQRKQHPEHPREDGGANLNQLVLARDHTDASGNLPSANRAPRSPPLLHWPCSRSLAYQRRPLRRAECNHADRSCACALGWTSTLKFPSRVTGGANLGCQHLQLVRLPVLISRAERMLQLRYAVVGGFSGRPYLQSAEGD